MGFFEFWIIGTLTLLTYYATGNTVATLIVLALGIVMLAIDYVVEEIANSEDKKD